ncbi:MAG: hypothetical protein IT385_14695 [Deltaproteobacteria bacterium]|nr:hypothetical protein [Deltaproteobacteria bacterium]
MLALVACESDPGEVAGHDPFGPISEAAVSTFEAVSADGATRSYTARREGERSIAGVDYGQWSLGDFTAGATPRGGRVWLDWSPGAPQVVVAGGEVFWPDNGLVASEPFASGTFDSPVTLDVAPPIGVPQALPVKATIVIGDPATSTDTIDLDVVATYTRVAADAVVATAAGPIAGCTVYEGSAEVLGQTYHASATYHPELGFLAASLDYPPPNGFSADLTGLVDYGVATNGVNVIKGMGVISPERPTFRLSTYDRAGEFDADKNVHAKMLVEVRWVDEAKARVGELPALFAPDFGTAIGYFPATFVASPVSLFHPAENGQGFTFWYAYVDQAAKNEAGGNGIAYHAGATLPDFVSSPMRVTARIIYGLYAP